MVTIGVSLPLLGTGAESPGAFVPQLQLKGWGKPGLKKGSRPAYLIDR
jgi:hypothetical protein